MYNSLLSPPLFGMSQTLAVAAPPAHEEDKKASCLRFFR